MCNKNFKTILSPLNDINDEKISNEQKEQFVAALAHDLKNPVIAQIKALELLSKGSFGELGEAQKEIVDMLMESSLYMKEMLYTLLLSYKYENGVVILNKTEFDIELFLKSCVKEIFALSLERKVKIVLRSKLNSKNKLIFADKCQLRRVVLNLLENGIYYAFKNSELIVNVEYSDRSFVFSIQTHSAPIPKEVRKRLFCKYVSGAEKLSKVGFGLGLYSSRQIVEAHCGKIGYVGNGTLNKFIFVIPAKQLDKPVVTVF